MAAQEFGPPMLTEYEREFYKNNPFAVWQWKASLGACVACTARDGRKYTLGDIPGRPHPNCKCQLRLVAGSAESATQATGPTPLEDLWYPEVDTTIFADCTMVSVGEVANAVQLRCNIVTHCIPHTRRDAESFNGALHRGVYQVFLYGPGLSASPVSVVRFLASFEIQGDYRKYKTPLHAMEGWANVASAGFARGAGFSFSRLELGDTMSISLDYQAGYDFSVGWYGGGYGRIVSYSSSQCGVFRD
ncbi:hypothetical protein [Megalodesulfovibrio paquesii]